MADTTPTLPPLRCPAIGGRPRRALPALPAAARPWRADGGPSEQPGPRELCGRVLETLAATIGPMPRVLLPDTGGGEDDAPLVRPASEEMPAPADRPARLQLLGEIARGGMGAVLKGRDPDLGRDLAVKVLLESHRDNARAGPPVRRGGPDRRPAPAPRHRAGLRAGHLRRPPAVLRHEAGQGPHPGRAARRAARRRPTTCPGSWRSSSRSARRWPTPTPGA